MEKVLKHYQLRFTNRGGCGMFDYFYAANEEAAEKIAVQHGNEYLENGRERDAQARYSFFHTPFKPIRTVEVVEYDRKNYRAVRGGHKFKIELRFMEIGFKSGRKERNEWYALKV